MPLISLPILSLIFISLSTAYNRQGVIYTIPGSYLNSLVGRSFGPRPRLLYRPGLSSHLLNPPRRQAIHQVPRVPRVQRPRSVPRPTNRCFLLHPNCILVNIAPFERRIRSTPQQCAQLCLNTEQLTRGADTCLSFNYDKTKHICDLFAVAGKHAPGMIMTHKFYDFYQMTDRCMARAAFIPPMPPPQPPSRPQTVAVGPFRTDLRRTTTTFTPPMTTTRATTTSAKPRGSCAAGTTPILLRLTGFRLKTIKTVSVGPISERQCVNYCSNDEIPQGDYNCFSATYDSSTRSCVLSEERAAPAGNKQLVAHNSVYLEKLCVRDEDAHQCPRAPTLERIKDKSLVALNEIQTTVHRFQLCLELCFDSVRNFGFICRSAMYYANKTTDNCILNKIDHNDEPSLFITETGKGLEFVSLAPCAPDKKMGEVLSVVKEDKESKGRFELIDTGKSNLKVAISKKGPDKVSPR